MLALLLCSLGCDKGSIMIFCFVGEEDKIKKPKLIGVMTICKMMRTPEVSFLIYLIFCL